MILSADQTNVVHFFWFNDKNGNKLDKISTLCINSAFLHGHQVNVWTYGKLDADDLFIDIVIRDANEIVDRTKFISQSFDGFKHSFAYFADYFRTILLKKERGWWSDTDCLFLKNISVLAKDYDYVVGLERVDSKGFEHHAGGIIYLSTKAGDNLIDYIADFISNEIEKTRNTGELAPWGTTCPGIITKVIDNKQDFKEAIYSYPRTAFYQVGWKNYELENYAYKKFAEASEVFQQFIFDNASDIYVCHLWNSLVDFDKVEKFSLYDIMFQAVEAKVKPTVEMIELVTKLYNHYDTNVLSLDYESFHKSNVKLLNYVLDNKREALTHNDIAFTKASKI